MNTKPPVGSPEWDQQYTLGWSAGLDILRLDRRAAFNWEFEVYRANRDPSAFDMGKADVISEHRVGF